MITTEKMCFGHSNIIRPANIVTVALVNCTATSGHPESNLKYADAWLRFKSNTPTGEPAIRFEFGSGIAANMTCIGFINHSLISAGYTSIEVEVGASSSGAWAPVSSAAVLTSLRGNPNFLLRFPAGSSAHWRIRFVKSGGGHAAFQLGAIFLGKYTEVTKPPPPSGATFHTFTKVGTRRRAQGGALHRQPGPQIREEHFECTILRMPASQYLMIHEDCMGDDDRYCAIVQPENAASVMPIGAGHFFGEIVSSNPSGTPDATAPHLYNATIVGEGIV